MAERRRERKVVTVLFADLVGFTARAEELDPEDVEAILAPYHERLRSELERFGGTVEKFIGDAVMALFGAPVAHEDDPERAVRAALAIRDWAREQGDVQVRIAVNTGEALVNLGARSEAGEGMAAGDVVNTGSRLQAAAPVNGVLVGEITYRATRRAIDYRGADPVEAKGKASPVAVWEAVQARSRFGVDVLQSAQTPLVGREREVGLLVDMLVRVREEGSPQLITLVGVPGIGKSRLLYELFRAVEQGGVLTYWRQGRSLPYGDGVTYWALADMVKAQAGILDTDDAEAVGAKLDSSVAALGVAGQEADWLRSHLRPLVGLGGEADVGGDRRTEAFAAWRRFLEAMAEERPLVLVFEDLHWADDGVLDFIDYLVEWAAPLPMLVVCTARPELLDRRPGWGGGKLNATTLSISPLSEQETARLFGALLEQPLVESEQQQALIARAGGNPLYAEQFAHMVLEGGNAVELQLPESVQGIIAARLDRLAPQEKSVLQQAAVHGKVFSRGSLTNGRSTDDLASALHALERKGFVQRSRRSSVGDDPEYAFLHVLVRDVAYGQIPRGDRAAMHLAAAEWIESLGRSEDHAEMLAHHYRNAIDLMSAARSAPPPDLVERTRLALADAGDRAISLNSFAAAERFLEQALDLAADALPDVRAHLEYSYALALFGMGDDRRIAALEKARDSLEACGDDGHAAEAETFLGEALWLHGRHDQMLVHLERAHSMVADAPPSPEKARVLAQVARFQMVSERNAEAVQSSAEALALAEQLSLDDLRADILATVGTARVNLGDLGGIDDLQRAIDLIEGVPRWQRGVPTTTWGSRSITRLPTSGGSKVSTSKRSESRNASGIPPRFAGSGVSSSIRATTSGTSTPRSRKPRR
jgi:class 3 adenylate cyclase/tetratricopeptide (TPR) repeat protein